MWPKFKLWLLGIGGFIVALAAMFYRGRRSGEILGASKEAEKEIQSETAEQLEKRLRRNL